MLPSENKGRTQIREGGVRQIFGCQKGAVTSDWRKLHDAEINS